MTYRIRFWPVFAALVLFYFVTALLLARRFPPVGIDEINGLVGAKSFLQGDLYHNFLVDDVTPVEATPYLSQTASVGRPLYSIWYGLGTALLPSGWLWGRLVSIVTGVIMMMFVARSGRKLGGDAAGLLSVGFLLLQPSFWLSSVVVNEILLAATAASGLIFFITTEHVQKEWGAVFLGGVLPLLVLIHPYAFLLSVAIGFLAVATKKLERPWLFMLGGVGGLALVLIGEPWKIGFQNPFYSFLAKPPILRGLSLSQWGEHVLSFFLHETSFYMPGAETFVGGLKLGFAIVWGAVLLVFLFSSKEARWVQSLWLGFFTLTIGLIFLASRTEGAYQIFLMVFLVPLVALLRRRRAWAVLVCSICAAFSFGWFVFRYIPTYEPHPVVAQELRGLAGLGFKRVMAPSVYMYDFPGSEFRDASVLSNARIYTEGRFQPQEWLKLWKPDVLVVDRGLAQILNQHSRTPQEMSGLFGRVMTFRGKVETRTILGDLYVFTF